MNEYKKYNSYELEKMFDNISYKYDFMNNLLSFNLHLKWKKQMIFFIKKIFTSGKILDVASGTGDISILLAKNISNCQIIGLDLSKNMISISKKKILKYKLFKNNIKFIKGNVEDIPYSSNYFDLTTISFGIRNFERINISLKEIYRVLKPGGYIIILEFSKPNNFIIKKLYNIYSLYIKKIASKISKYPYTYKYLIKSIENFSQTENLEKILSISGFIIVNTISLTFGIVSIYIAKKNYKL